MNNTDPEAGHPCFHPHDDPEELGEALAEDVARRLSAALTARRAASLVVPGGTTPGPMFRRLRETPLEWDLVTVTLSDERRVPADDAASNERLVRETLLQGPAARATMVGLAQGADDALTEESRCHRRLDGVPRPYDVVVLGMGADGHTASLFPGAPELNRALDADDPLHCRCITGPSEPSARITQSLASLLNSYWIVLYFTGATKREVFRQALEPGAVADLPVRALLHQRRVPVDVYWSP